MKITLPRMKTPPLKVSSLAWYAPTTPGLLDMQYEARDEVVPLRYADPYGSDLIGVPRTLSGELTFTSKDERSIGNHEFEATFKSDLRPEQVPFLNEAFYTLENECGLIGEAPTGFGKSVCGVNLITRIGRTTCIVVPKTDLPWIEEILKHTDIPKERIDTWSGQKLPNPDAWVVVATLQSVYRVGHYPQEVYRRFGCLIVDEVHRVGSSEFSNVMRLFPAMWRLGFSATPERRDGKMDLIHAHMGWRHVVGYSDAQQPDYYVIPTSWSEPFDKAGKRVKYDPSRTNHAKRSLMSDMVRNSQIAAAVYRAHKAGRRIIVFVEQIKHAERLKAALLSMKVPAFSIIEYNGETLKEERERAERCDPGTVLLATYKYTAEGTNIPALDTAVIAHPIFDPRQAIGRILRKVPGKPKPIVLDVWDPHSASLDGIGKVRWETMRKRGATWKGVFR